MNKKNRGRNHDRSADNTQLSVSISKQLRERIEAAARAEDRSISSYIRVHLAEVLDRREESAAD